MNATYADTHALLSAIADGDAAAKKLYNFYWYIGGYVTDIELLHDGVIEWVRYTYEETRYEVPLSVVDENTEDPSRVDDHVLFAE